MPPSEPIPGTASAAATKLFGDRVELAIQFADLLKTHGVARGLIGPREGERLWDRHLLNSAVVAELIPSGATVTDVGSGGGFPGIPLAIGRRDIRVTLVEPMARRVDWLAEVVETLSLDNVSVVRGRAEDVVGDVEPADVVTARAVAPLAKLARWCFPLVRPGGVLLALKGSSADEEVDRDRAAVGKVGAGHVSVVQCGLGLLEVPTTVVMATKARRAAETGRRPRKK